MASLSDLGKIANDFGFQMRCMQAAAVAAEAVMMESAQTTSHTQRIGYAIGILNSTVTPISIARGILTNPTISQEAAIPALDEPDPTKAAPGYNIADGDIQFTMNSIFNALAGISN